MLHHEMIIIFLKNGVALPRSGQILRLQNHSFLGTRLVAMIVFSL